MVSGEQVHDFRNPWYKKLPVDAASHLVTFQAVQEIESLDTLSQNSAQESIALSESCEVAIGRATHWTMFSFLLLFARFVAMCSGCAITLGSAFAFAR